MSSKTLEDYLPPDSPKLTYSDLLKGYGEWWQAQPSLTPYKRFYDIDSEPHYLIVWEGFAGVYDFYGNFAEDNTFYNKVVKGYMIHFHIGITNRMLHVRMYTALTSKPDYDRYYKNPAEMRANMIAEWPQIAPTLGDQGEKLKQFIDNNADRVIALLNEYAKARTEAAPDCHTLVYRFDDHIYLCLWTGAKNAIVRVPEPDRFGSHVIYRDRMTSYYATFDVSFVRLPVRFTLTLTQWSANQPVKSRQITPSDRSISSFEEFKTLLDTAIRDLPF